MDICPSITIESDNSALLGHNILAHANDLHGNITVCAYVSNEH